MADLSQFPIYIQLLDDADMRAVASDSHDDLVFVSAASSNVLDHEVEARRWLQKVQSHPYASSPLALQLLHREAEALFEED